MQETKKIKWLIAHEPVDLFLRTAKAFSKDVYERTNGAIEIEIFTASEFSKKYNRWVGVITSSLIKFFFINFRT